MKDKETGIQTESQEFKSAKQNLKAAFHKMVNKLKEHYASLEKKQEEKRQNADFGERRIRTYNEVDDRVVDEQTGDKYSYRHTVGRGDITEIIDERRKKVVDIRAIND